MKFYNLPVEETLDKLKTSKEGLSKECIKERLDKYGKNELKKEKKTPLYKKILEQICDPMIIMLLVAAVISGIIDIMNGDSATDVVIILVVVFINSFLGVYQESKAENALDSLQSLTKNKSVVIRSGQKTTIDTSDIVVGDIVVLSDGDIVPCDGRIIESYSMKIEEAALTGESVSVDKCIDILECKKNSKNKSDFVSLADRKNMAYSGTTVVYGHGLMVACATGMNTEIGKIASELNTTKKGMTPLQIKMAQLSKILTKIVIVICIVVFLTQMLSMSSLTVELILKSFMIAVTLAVAAIPEGLPAVVTVVLSIGVTKMSKRHAIIRKLNAVETLGCASVICSDKTGTLTQNKMTVKRAYGNEDVLSIGMPLCCDSDKTTGDPTEIAIICWADKLDNSKELLNKKYPRIAEAPFDSSRKMMSTIHKVGDSNYIQYTKGGLDVLLDRCSKVLENDKELELTDELKSKIIKANDEFSDDALRVLACAYKKYTKVPDTNNTSQLESDLVFVGFVGMIDPVRLEVKPAIEKAHCAGITTIMITGDHKNTAVAIAREINVLNKGCDIDKSVLTGDELSCMTDEEFKNKFRDVRVYARVAPEHKTRIVDAWQKADCVVAMTGDGVNDAPSIKKADIGIGMGITGTDVTKNVSDMVLTDDNFASIVSAVEEGRTIYNNILKAIQYLLASNFCEVLCVFLTSLCGFSFLSPVQLLWINLVTDTFPALALGFEKSEDGVMKSPPRSTKSSIFSNGLGFDIVYQGLATSVLCLISFFIGMYIEDGYIAFAGSTHGTTCAFLTMVMVEIFHAFNMRSLKSSIFKLKTQNLFLWISTLISFILTTIICEMPFFADAFGFTSVGMQEYFIAILLGFCIIPIVECVKFIQRKANIK